MPNNAVLTAAEKVGEKVTNEAKNAIKEGTSQVIKETWAQIFGAPLSDEQASQRENEEKRIKLEGINRLHQQVNQITYTTTRPKQENQQENQSQDTNQMRMTDTIGTKKAPPPLASQKGMENRGGRGIGG